MNRFRTILALGLMVTGCGSLDPNALKNLSVDVPREDGGAEPLIPFGGSGGSENTSDAGLSGSVDGDAGGSNPEADAGADVNQGGSGGTDGGAGGSDVGQAGTDQGTGGTEQGGAGGSDVGEGGSDQGGTGGTVVQPPVCNYQGGTCEGLYYRECDGGEYFEYPCDFNCEDDRGCFGHCTNGDTRCSEETAETCVDGEWETTEECAFQCLAGACAGACSPGTVVCDGLSTVTCGSDFHFAEPVACPTDPNGTASCSDGVCDLQPVACSASTADCDGNWSCEADLTSIETCGSCDTACNPNPAHASPTCTVSGCGLSCDDGFADCDGDPANGCEQDISTDALNCGACGNSCFGTTCDAGQCEYDFEVVSDYSGEGTFVRDMATSTTHVYWLTQTELRRAPNTGGAYETLATLSAEPSVLHQKVLVVEAGKVAWTTLDGVYVMSEAGGAPTHIFTTTNATAVLGIAGANGKVYWNSSRFAAGEHCITTQTFNDEAAFRACNMSKVTTFRTFDLETSVTSSWQIAGEYSAPLTVSGGEMVVATFAPAYRGHSEYDVYVGVRDAATGSSLRTIGGTVRVSGIAHSAHSELSAVAFTEDSLVYATSLHGGEANSGIIAGPLAGGGDPLVTNALISTEMTREIVADGTTAYYRHGDAGTHTGVHAVSLTGEALAPIFENETDDVLQLAIDDAYIYFTAYTNGGEQAILRAPK